MKKPVGIIIVLILLAIIFFATTGFFVIQPLGMLPEGLTIWYFRAGVKLPFVTSPDGFLLKQGTGISLLGRMMAAGELMKVVGERKIVRLPYIKALYLISTGGAEYEK